MSREENSQSNNAQDAPDLRRALERSIEANPLSALAIAAGAGFLIGGGLRNRLGRALLAFAGRKVAKELMLSAIATSIDGSSRRNLKTSGSARRGRNGSPAESVRSQSPGRSGRH